MDLAPLYQYIAEQLQEAAALSHNSLRSTLASKLDGDFPGGSAYMADHVGDDVNGTVIYHQGGKMYSAPYSITKGAGKVSANINHDNRAAVVPHVTYAREGGDPVQADTSEAQTISMTGDLIPLREGAVGQDGSAYLKLIAPGWGSSGYYSPDVLKRDVAKAFPAGTKNFWNHPTAAQEAARPEGDLRDLASVLTEDAKYLEGAAAPAGDGAYARATVVDAFRQPIENLAPHIGMSIRAEGKARTGTAAGRKGHIIEELTRGLSVDYVTSPGAGGKVLKLFEAAGRLPEVTNQGDDSMDETAVKRMIAEALKEQGLEVARLREQVAVLSAPAAVAKLLESADLPPNAKTRLANRIVANVPLNESGRVDEAKLKTLVDFEVSEAQALMETVGPMRFGRQIPLDATSRAAAASAHDTNFKEAMTEIADIFCDGRKTSMEHFITGRSN
jgi:hypothetical protein